MRADSSDERKDTDDSQGKAIVDRLLLLLIGVIVVVVAVIVARRRLTEPAPRQPQQPAPTVQETAAWRNRAHDVYVAGHSTLGELTAESISACKPGDAVRREWLLGAVAQTRETVKDARQLAGEAATRSGRDVVDGLVRALNELADAASAQLAEPSTQTERRLADARSNVESSLSALRRFTQ